MMKKSPPSIFNDVIGPVMRGPSSSHCAAAVRIGRIARDLMDGEIKDVLLEIDPQGSLATTHKSQGSDMGLCAGLLGWDLTDVRLVDSPNAIREAGIELKIAITTIHARHPNTYRLRLTNSREIHTMTAISTGGGIIEVTEIDGIGVSMAGDHYETLLHIGTGGEELVTYINENIPIDDVQLHQGENADCIEVKSQDHLGLETVASLKGKFDIHRIQQIAPVLPILTQKEIKVPFISPGGILDYNKVKNHDLWELAVIYEAARGGISSNEVLEKMDSIIDIMRNAIQTGLAGTEYADRILGNQSGGFQKTLEHHQLIDGGVLNRIILYITALMETKSSMGLIVAAPTAGSCGGLPAACFGVADVLGLGKKELTHAMLAGGLIGVFIAEQATFAAEIGGCQAECGAGSGMAAAALVSLAGGSTQQAVNAASMALQNTLGMICDPVANRVEVPCLGKNVMAASNALACANMALADYDPVIPLDEVIRTMDEVGKMLPSPLRCTGGGGLSITKTAKEIEKRLAHVDQESK